MRIRTDGALLMGLSILAACTGGQTGDENTTLPPDAGRPDAGSSDDFLDSLGGSGFGNYDAASSVAELADRSERIAVGRIGSVRPGRSLSLGRSDRPTAVLVLSVTDMLKGEPAEELFLELYMGFVFDAARVPDPLPENRLLVFAIPVQGDAPWAVDGGPGLPEGETLYWLTTPQGMVIEEGSGQAAPADPIFRPGSFDSVVQAVRELP